MTRTHGAAALGLAALSLLAWRPELYAAPQEAARVVEIGPTAAERRQAAREFHARAQERTGLLVPLYAYPADVHTNAVYNRLMDAKRRHETVPVWVILNPASGPGKQVDANYTKAIDRLQGSGCVTLGYVSTAYGKRTTAEVQKDNEAWRRMYPKMRGIFFDEMDYADTNAAAGRQAALNRHARATGFWPTVANPGADTPGRFFENDCADVFVVHEGNAWPKQERLHGNYFGGYADHPPWTRAVLLHSTPTLDAAALKMARKHARWVYVTEGAFRAGDPAAANPWDRLSVHLEVLLEQLAAP